MRSIKSLIKKKPSPHSTIKDNTSEEIILPEDLTAKVKLLKPYLTKNQDIVSRSFVIEGAENLNAVVIYLEGIIDTAILNRDVLNPLLLYSNREQIENEGPKHLIDRISQTSLNIGQIKKLNTFSDLIQNIFDGLTILIFDGFSEVLALDIRGGEIRGITEPDTEKTLRGPREGFVESLIVNIALIRRKLRDPNLTVEKTIIGKRTRTDVAIIYIQDIASSDIVSNIKEKLSNIDIDGVLDTGYIEQLIEDNPFSFFPQFKSTERPDKTIAHLLEGKVLLMANGIPSALIVPSLFVQFLQAPEDYYERTFIGSFTRMLRYLAFFLAISLPAIYVALLSYQQQLIPFDLIVSLAESRKEVPFPVAVEALVLEIIIQLVMETGLRLPTSFGQTVGVVGGIILGQAAISARLASPAIVIITAVTTICTFAMSTPGMALSTRVLRLPMLLLASSFGIFGVTFGWLIILGHLSSLESLGIPYFSPFAPFRFADLKDSFYRTFLWKMKKRPVSIPSTNKKRQGTFKKKDNQNEN